MPERIQLSREKGWRMPPNTVRVTRPGLWGNPFRLEDYFAAGWSGTTEVAAQHCVDAFRAMLEGRKHWAHPIPMEYPVPSLQALRGKNLACWCKPGAPCHADVLLELANRPDGVPVTSAPDDKITIRYERAGRCFWHIGCAAQRHAPPMAIGENDAEKRRTVIRCGACGKAGYYPHGGFGEVRCEPAPDGVEVNHG